MALIKDIAIALRRLDYSETSQVLSMLTREHGQRRVIAKGIKRGTKTRVAVGIDLLEMGRIVFSQRSGREDAMATMTEWHQEDNFPHLRRDLVRCYSAQYAAEVTSHLTEAHDPHPALFDALRRLLGELKETDPLAALVDYLWLMLREIGLRPELDRCMNCNRELSADRMLYFSSRQGGAICRDCEPSMIEKRRISRKLVANLPSDTTMPAGGAAEAFEMLDYHLREIMSRPAKLSGTLRAALALPANH